MIRPVNVLEQDDGGQLLGNPAHELGRVAQSPVSDLTRISEHRLDDRAGREVELISWPSMWAVVRSLPPGAEEDLHAVLELGALDLGGVALLNAEPGSEQVPDKCVLESRHLLMGATANIHTARAELDRAHELEHERDFRGRPRRIP